MRVILTKILSLCQHLQTLKTDPERYRPSYCPHCGKSGLWQHGRYHRKSDRENPPERSLNPIPIPRFYCQHCAHTCSVLPECIPPKRWYLWLTQEAVLLLHMQGYSHRKISQSHMPSRFTVSRWVTRGIERFTDYASALKSHFSWLGYCDGFVSFWQRCLSVMSLSSAMVVVNQSGMPVP